jgi:hypothetical protein
VARAAQRFLHRQAELLELQADGLKDERELRRAQLLDQAREGRIRRLGQRIRVIMQMFSVLGVSVVALVAATLLWGAFTSRSVVVDVFKAPAVMAPSGVTGDVVAEGVLDTLQKLQAATRSSTKGLGAAGAWSSDIKIQVPDTGLSLGEIDRTLHERFGHDLRIDGDLVQTTTGGLALTVRGDGVPASTFVGAAGDLDKLTTQAAEYIYGRAQPSRFAAYLMETGRQKDALAFLPGAYARRTTSWIVASLLTIGVSQRSRHMILAWPLRSTA